MLKADLIREMALEIGITNDAVDDLLEQMRFCSPEELKLREEFMVLRDDVACDLMGNQKLAPGGAFQALRYVPLSRHPTKRAVTLAALDSGKNPIKVGTQYKVTIKNADAFFEFLENLSTSLAASYPKRDRQLEFISKVLVNLKKLHAALSVKIPTSKDILEIVDEIMARKLGTSW